MLPRWWSVLLLVFMHNGVEATPKSFVAWYITTGGYWRITTGLAWATKQCIKLNDAISYSSAGEYLGEALDGVVYSKATEIVHYSVVQAGHGYWYAAGNVFDNDPYAGAFSILEFRGATSSGLVEAAAKHVAEAFGMGANVYDYNPITKRDATFNRLHAIYGPSNTTNERTSPQFQMADLASTIEVIQAKLQNDGAFTNATTLRKRAGQCYSSNVVYKCINWEHCPNCGYKSQGSFSCFGT